MFGGTFLFQTRNETQTKSLHQLNSVDGETYPSLLSQPCEGQSGLIKWAGGLKGGYRFSMLHCNIYFENSFLIYKSL